MSGIPEPSANAARAPALNLWFWVLAAAGVYFLSFFIWPPLFDLVAVSHYGVWFSDWYAVLASNDALAAGRDVYAGNPLDHYGRPHGYPFWWLYLGKIGLTRADNLWLGATIALAAFATAAARLRPRNFGQAAWYLAIWCSPPFVFALERGNNDLVMFILLAAVVPCVASSRPLAPFIALGVIAFATKLKFYPAVAGVLLFAGEKRREIWWRVVIATTVLGLVAWSLRDDYRTFNFVAPHPKGLLSLGAKVGPDLLGWSEQVTMLFCGGVLLAALFFWWRTDIFAGWSMRAEDHVDWLNFLLGAVLLAGCFFASNNYSYRLIFAVWLAPLLWKLPRDETAPPKVRRLAHWTGVLLVAVLWTTPFIYGLVKYLRPRRAASEVKAVADFLLLAEQPVIWLFFICLLGFLAHFVRERARWLFASAARSAL